MRSDFPRSPDELTSDYFSRVLGVDVDGFDMYPLGAASGHLGALVSVEIADHVPLVAKFAAPRQAARDAARRGGLFEREVMFYSRLAAEMSDLTPRCHDAAFDPETGEFVLLLDRLEAIAEFDAVVGIGPERTRQVLDTLSRVHRAGTTHWREPWLQTITNRQRIANLRHLVEAGWPRLCELTPDLDRSLGSHLNVDLERSMARLGALPQTVVHGDAKPDNMIATDGGIRLIDWQAVGSAPPAWDIAYSITQCLTASDISAHGRELLEDHSRDLDGLNECWTMGLVVAAALTVLGDPTEPRVKALAKATARRTLVAMEELVI